MFLFLSLFFIKSIKCEETDQNEEDDDSFWKDLEEESNQKVEVIDNPQITTYDKARFNLPLQRRLNSLFPDVAKAVRDLQDISRIEFVYEEKFPILSFLDSQDVVVEKIEIGKKSKDEIKSMLTMRGFDINLKRQDVEKKLKEQQQQNENITQTSENSTQTAENITETNENTTETNQQEKISDEQKDDIQKPQIEEPYPEEQTIDTEAETKEL